MNEIVMINPGAGSVRETSNTQRNARRNIGALCRDAALIDPKIQIIGKGCREEGEYDDGRYNFILKRGFRKIDVAMPGIALKRVRFMNKPGQNIWNFPRLYVDGNSWIWSIAINIVKEALIDHDGVSKRGYDASAADCAFVMAHEPRCPTCGSIRDVAHPDKNGTVAKNPPHGYQTIRCVTCMPVTRISMLTWRDSSVVLNYKEPKHDYGPLFRVTTKLMPYEALGTDAGGRVVPYACRRGYYTQKPQCRLTDGHGGNCEPRWKEIERVRFEYPYEDVGETNTDLLIEVVP